MSHLINLTEELERRALLSSATLSTGVLTIEGDVGTANNIVLRRTAENELGVVINGGEEKLFGGCDLVTRIIVNGGNEADRLAVDESARELGIAVEMNGGIGDDTLLGGSGDDMLQGGVDDDSIMGNGGNDRLFGFRGEDLLLGGDGDDFAKGSAGDDTVSGGDGNDRLWGNLGDDSVSGDAGNDTFYGGPDADAMFGGDGDDTFRGGNPRDKVDGGAGDDRVVNKKRRR
jgi:Ca2+-binding RTX toxin-like protein